MQGYYSKKDLKKSLSLRFSVPETDVNCVLWATYVDFFITAAIGSKNNGSSEGGRDSRSVKVGSRQTANGNFTELISYSQSLVDSALFVPQRRMHPLNLAVARIKQISG